MIEVHPSASVDQEITVFAVRLTGVATLPAATCRQWKAMAPPAPSAPEGVQRLGALLPAVLAKYGIAARERLEAVA